MKGKLYLIPAKLGDSPWEKVLPPEIQRVINSINFFIVENERSARRYLISLGIEKAIDDLSFFVLNNHTTPTELSLFLDPLNHSDMGLISEAGAPAVADPGGNIVRMAHNAGVQVIPLVGPSSILLALMASGLNGQNFCFHGYLPVKDPERNKKIKELEMDSKRKKQTQIFIEAPYRNNQMLTSLITSCNENTLLSISANLTTNEEFIFTTTIQQWKKKKPDFHKQPAIFLLLAE